MINCDDVSYRLNTLCAKCVANVCDNMADLLIALQGASSSSEVYFKLQLR
jgi:hypothetical protein